MKQLPIGIQSIREVIEGGYLYIDKTAFAYQLIKTGKHYFIARPQRFGKSLFIDTLAEILRGNKALFRDCVIAQKDYDWQTYPIVLFNFEQMACSNPLEFEESLRKRSQAIAQEYALSTTSYLQQASPPNI